ncbi:MAG: hypothetical protein NTU73_12225 [Ignavibacteriae bacterium]|nr:hypothetical protein [Ignavibacteriota bacterium]
MKTEDITLILSILGALAWLPFIINLIKDFLTKPKITIISDKQIEIGYTTNGPIINLYLAFAGEKKDALINKIKLILIHEKSEKQEFEWQWFEEELLEMEVPNTGFVPYKKKQQAIALKLLKDNLIEKKIGFQVDSIKSERNKLINYLNEISENYIKESLEFNNLKAQKEYIDLISLSRNSFIWKVGNYKLSIETYIYEKNETFKHDIKFKLTTLDLKKLEKNISLINKVVESSYITHDTEFKETWNWVYPIKINDFE